MSEYFVHPTAIVEDGAIIQPGAKIWHHAHIRPGAQIGGGCNIGKNVYVDSGVSIGPGSKIQNNVSVYHGVTIGRDVFVGPSAVFTNDLMPRAALWSEERLVHTIIEDGASIGANATIICGTKVGGYAMIGAGSVVTRDVAPYALVFGNPARIRGAVCRCGKRIAVADTNHVIAAGKYSCDCGAAYRVDEHCKISCLEE